MKEPIDKIRDYYDHTIKRVSEQRRKTILMRPPFQWAQSLHTILMEVKYAYRHDVAGCATLFNQSVVANNTHIRISAYCQEQDHNLHFEVAFPFWAAVNASTLKWEYQPVGKHFITVEKLNKPARWRYLYKEGS